MRAFAHDRSDNPPPDGRRFRSANSARLLLATGAVASTLLVGGVAGEVVLRTVFDPVRVLDGETMWEYRWRRSLTASSSDEELSRGYVFDRFDADSIPAPRPNELLFVYRPADRTGLEDFLQRAIVERTGG